MTFDAESRFHVPLPPIIYEDEHIVAFDKPSGLPVAPDHRDKPGENLMALVHSRLGRNVANVHRLDSGASGVLLCAKSKSALEDVYKRQRLDPFAMSRRKDAAEDPCPLK